MRTLGVMLLAAVAALAQHGLVEGKVVNAVTGEPVKQATVKLTGRRSVEAVTGADGILFRDVAEGMYRVQASHPQMEPGTESAVAMARGEQRAQRITLKLTTMGSATGRITDNEGQPLEGCAVEAFRRPPNSSGDVQAMVVSNEEGLFDFKRLLSGRYYFQARCQEALPGRHGFVRRSEAWRAPQHFHLEAALPAGAPAERIEIKAGTMAEKLEFRLAKAVGYKVKGSVVGTPSYVSIQFVPDGALVDAPRNLRFRRYSNATGVFESGPLLPGGYTVIAERLAEKWLWGRTHVVVGSEALAMEIAVEPVPPIRITVEADERGTSVSWQSVDRLTDSRPGGTGLSESGSVEARLSPGRWSIRVDGLPEDRFVDKVRVGDTDFAPSDVRIDPGTSEVRVFARGIKATVEATVADGEGAVIYAAAAAPVVGQRGSSWKNAIGSRPVRLFLEPGEHLLVAVPAEPFRQLPYGFIEKHGTRIEVREGETRQITLKAIQQE